MPLDLAEHVIHVKSDGLGVHLVALQSGRFPNRRLDQGSHGRVAEAIDRPFALRHFPIERSIRGQAGGEIDDLVLRHDARGGQRQHGDVAIVRLSPRDLRLLDAAVVGVIDGKGHVRAGIDAGRARARMDLRRARRRRLREADFLHREFGRDPRPAVRLIAGAIVDAEIEPEPPRLGRRAAYELPPRVAHVGDHVGVQAAADLVGPGRADVAEVAHRRAAEAGRLEDFQIAADSLRGDVSPHPEPIDQRPGRVGGIAEHGLRIVGRRGGGACGRNRQHAGRRGNAEGARGNSHRSSPRPGLGVGVEPINPFFIWRPHGLASRFLRGSPVIGCLLGILQPLEVAMLRLVEVDDADLVPVDKLVELMCPARPQYRLIEEKHLVGNLRGTVLVIDAVVSGIHKFSLCRRLANPPLAFSPHGRYPVALRILHCQL